MCRSQIESNINSLDFRDILIWLCNDDLHLIASQGVYWLMLILSLGILSVEYNQKIDFIEDEIKSIIVNNDFERLKHRINTSSYNSMQEDLEKTKQFYELL